MTENNQQFIQELAFSGDVTFSGKVNVPTLDIANNPSSKSAVSSESIVNYLNNTITNMTNNFTSLADDVNSNISDITQIVNNLPTTLIRFFLMG